MNDVPQSDESMSLALRTAVKTAAKAAGGKNKLACMLGISGPAVYMWKQIPTKRVLEIERLTNVRREILRPDLYQTSTLEVLETEEAGDMSPALRAAIKAAGGLRALASLIGVTHAAIRKWDCVPAKRVVDVERATGIPREQLRPDLYRHSSIDEALAIVKAAGYRVVKPRASKCGRKPKDRVGPTFVCEFADGTITRMSTFTSIEIEKLDWDRGMRLSIAAYQSRWRTRALAQYHKQNGGQRLTRWQYRENAINLVTPVPPAIIASHFEQDGKVLAQRNGGAVS